MVKKKNNIRWWKVAMNQEKDYCMVRWSCPGKLRIMEHLAFLLDLSKASNSIYICTFSEEWIGTQFKSYQPYNIGCCHRSYTSNGRRSTNAYVPVNQKYVDQFIHPTVRPTIHPYPTPSIDLYPSGGQTKSSFVVMLMSLTCLAWRG